MYIQIHTYIYIYSPLSTSPFPRQPGCVFGLSTWVPKEEKLDHLCFSQGEERSVIEPLGVQRQPGFLRTIGHITSLPSLLGNNYVFLLFLRFLRLLQLLQLLLLLLLLVVVVPAVVVLLLLLLLLVVQ